ncbi:lactate utilization protein B/C [Rudanella paleaurantiibacter]|uniref:Lactate utilization protein B/C n=1 Tax=Rudanella paleaurantiibacter TaxID=2614655 RepID=A0A7J5TTS4_9BACT|nr:LUD domain-containing protein [Rudanella paleaurantiibacter]KAB7727276.1 lactate utilization protein B/C [Rudanella paleaurantiibacter]
MNSRERILSTVRQNQPISVALPLVTPPDPVAPLSDTFCKGVERIGGQVIRVQDPGRITAYVREAFGPEMDWVSAVDGLAGTRQLDQNLHRGHTLATVELAICAGHFGVAENGAIWVTDDSLPHRALPFLCQHLGLVVAESALVATMHDAYRLLDGRTFDYGVFIAGPSKTADIEQSLVIGAHGPRSLTVFLLADSL